MSNTIPENPQVLVGEPVPVTIVEAPKKPGKFKTALRHPIQTTKRHRVAAAATAGVVLGSVATLLLCKSDDEIDLDADANLELDLDSDDTV